MTGGGRSAAHAVRVVEHQWIELADGVRLSARLRLPVDPDPGPVPAVLEYVPYRKDDGTLLRDNRQHDYLAARGFAMVRVDIRGSGDSDGVLRGEYLARELQDGVEVIDWISRQPWCNGRVGIMGISWGGFNALQVAALQPPALSAAVTVAATDDRYATDVHYLGGCVLAADMLGWSATMACFNARPATPRIVVAGDAATNRLNRWRANWLQRLEETPIFAHDWLSHQRRDGFWEHGSVCEDYVAIRCPVLTVGGLADGYTDTVFRLAAGLQVPYRAIIGPWSHNYPIDGVPGPNIDFLGELVEFFDRYLGPESGDQGRGHADPDRLVDVAAAEADAAWAAEPLRIWVQDHVPPAPSYVERPGRWVAEPSWPSPNVSMQPRWLTTAGRLSAECPVGPFGNVSGGNPLTTGLLQGNWWGYAAPGQLPADQQLESDPAFRFDDEPADEPVDLVGIPELALRLAVDAPVAQVAARLCDVAPDGSMLQISRGVLNLTHRHGHRDPTPMKPGEWADAVVTLDGVAHRLPVGHHLSLLLTTSLWPLVWPSPTEVVLTLELGPGCELRLPVRLSSAADSDTLSDPAFGEPAMAPDQAELTAPPSSARTITTDATTGVVTVTDRTDVGTIAFDDHRTAMSFTAVDTWAIAVGDPLSARAVSDRTWSIDWPEESIFVWIETRSEMWCDATRFHTRDIVTAHVDHEVFFSQTYEFSTPRDHQ